MDEWKGSGLEELPWRQSPSTADMRAELTERGFKPFSEDELKEFAALFFEVIEKMMPGGERARSWVHLFKKMDDDGSNLIRFDELANLVKVELKNKTKLADAKLRQLWITLDKDDSDTVTREEFGKFMRLAEPDDDISAAERAAALREGHLAAEEARVEAAKANAGYNSMKTAEVRAELKQNGIEAMAEAELTTLATTFNERLNIAHPGCKYFTLFQLTDDDGSGLLMFDELVKVVRLVTRDGGLGLTPEDLSIEKLKQLWITLDANDSDTLSVDEFGKWMNLGTSRAGQGAQHEARVAEKLEAIKARDEAAEADAAKKIGYNKMKTAKAREELKAKGLAPLTEDELVAVSKTFNEKLQALIDAPGSTYQNVFSLFQRADDDGSGRIMFDELLDVVRVELTMPAADMSEQKLTQLWCALDKDDSDTMEIGEFGHFMHLGSDGRAAKGELHDKRVADKLEAIKAKDAAEEAAVAKRIDSNKMKTAKVRAELKEKGLKDLTTDELKDFSKKFNDRLQILMDEPGSIFKGWFSLFQQADDDGSGRIMFDELLDVMRVELKMTAKEVSEQKAKQLWCALDKNDSNTLETDEFGKFMLLSGPERKARGSQQENRQADKVKAINDQEAAEEADAAKKIGYNAMKTAELREELKEKGLQPLTEDELKNLSAKFNATLHELTKGANHRSWLQMFQQIDDDGSGLITYAELIDLVRDELQQKKTDMPDIKVKQLWCALDKDNSNHCSQDEFGRFMQLSVVRNHAGAYERRAEALRKAKQAKVEAAENALLKINGMNVLSTAQIRVQLDKLGVSPMNEEEQKEISVRFNGRLEYMLPGRERARSWLTLFKEVDVDGSGLITYDELVMVVREKLKITKTDLTSVQVKALWCALDADGGGQLSQAEFGRFMQLATRDSRSRSPRPPLPELTTLAHNIRAKPLPPMPGANRPQGPFADAWKASNVVNPPAPPPRQAYEESIWLPKNWKKLNPPLSKPRGPHSRDGSPTSSHVNLHSPSNISESPSADYRSGSRSSRMLPSIGKLTSPSLYSNSSDLGGDNRWPAAAKPPFSKSAPTTPRSPNRQYGSRSSRRKLVASPKSSMTGLGRETAASKAASIWALGNVRVPPFAVTPLEHQLVHDISMHMRIAYYQQMEADKRMFARMRDELNTR